jgi:hypothetical protein
MRDFTFTEQAYLQARNGVHVRLLVWIAAKNLTTGTVEPAGFWNGDDNAQFTIKGETRNYFGASALLGMDDITMEIGLDVRNLSIWLSTAAPEVIDAVMGYDTRLAPVQVHRALFDPVSHQLIFEPRRIWKGLVDGAPLVRPAKGISGGRITLSVASNALSLHRALTGKWSDGAMQRRGGDRLFRYADISGKVPVYWGEQRFDAPAAAPTAAAPTQGGLNASGFGRSSER